MHIHIINERLNLLYAYFLRFNIWSLSVYIGMKKWWFTPQKCSNYSYYGMRLCDDDKTDFKLSCNVWLFDLLRVWIFFLFFKSPRCVTSDAFFGTETKKMKTIRIVNEDYLHSRNMQMYIRMRRRLLYILLNRKWLWHISL